MKSRPDMKSKAFSVLVLMCVPLMLRCIPDSDGGGTSGAGGEVEGGAGNGGLAHGGHAGSGHAGSAGESTSGGTDAAGTAGGVGAGTGGVSDCTGGASAGTGGVSAGTGGASAGTGGASAGTGGASAGTGGVSAGTGGVSAGTGGVSAGTGGVSAGTGGVSAGTGGVSAGTGGVSAGTGGSAGVAGAGPGILNVSTSILQMIGECTSPPQTFTISNAGESALTWTAALNAPLIAVTPSSSTLQPGTAITVSVSAKTPVPVAAIIVITITSDVVAQPPTTISVQYAVRGTLIGVQPDIDVGEVPLGQSKTVSVPVPTRAVELALGSSNSAFSVPDVLAHGADHWNMIFTPNVLGPQSTTLQIIVPFGTGGPVCPSPNLFTARGVGVAP